MYGNTSMLNIAVKFHHFFPPASLILKFHGLQNYPKILDLGCGNNSVLKVFKDNYKMGIDAFEEYIEQSKEKKIHQDYLMADINQLNLDEILPKFDAVIVFDVLEHLTLGQAQELVNKIESASNIKFIAFRTPSVFLEQENYDENEYQRHLSNLSSSYFINKGYSVYGVDGPSFLNIEGNLPRRTFSISKTLFSTLLRPVYLFLPNHSMNYLAIKVR